MKNRKSNLNSNHMLRLKAYKWKIINWLCLNRNRVSCDCCQLNFNFCIIALNNQLKRCQSLQVKSGSMEETQTQSLCLL